MLRVRAKKKAKAKSKVSKWAAELDQLDDDDLPPPTSDPTTTTSTTTTTATTTAPPTASTSAPTTGAEEVDDVFAFGVDAAAAFAALQAKNTPGRAPGKTMGKTSSSSSSGMKKYHTNPENPRVWMEISIQRNGGLGRRTQLKVEYEVFEDLVPGTAENFVKLATGEGRRSAVSDVWLHYEGTRISTGVPSMFIEGGNVHTKYALGAKDPIARAAEGAEVGESIHGGVFDDESFVLRHSIPGLLSMSNAPGSPIPSRKSRKNNNGSVFMVTLAPLPALDRRQVVFGRVVSGFRDLEALASYGSESGEMDPDYSIVITGSGVVGGAVQISADEFHAFSDGSALAKKRRRNEKLNNDRRRNPSNSNPGDDRQRKRFKRR